MAPAPRKKKVSHKEDNKYEMKRKNTVVTNGQSDVLDKKQKIGGRHRSRDKKKSDKKKEDLDSGDIDSDNNNDEFYDCEEHGKTNSCLLFPHLK
jgi:hypothetical protein